MTAILVPDDISIKDNYINTNVNSKVQLKINLVFICNITWILAALHLIIIGSIKADSGPGPIISINIGCLIIILFAFGMISQIYYLKYLIGLGLISLFILHVIAICFLFTNLREGDIALYIVMGIINIISLLIEMTNFCHLIKELKGTKILFDIAHQSLFRPFGIHVVNE